MALLNTIPELQASHLSNIDAELKFFGLSTENLPEQFVFETISEIPLKQFNPENQKIWVCVDGAEKSNRLGENIDEIFYKKLSSLGIEFQTLNLSQLLHLKIEDLHASLQNVSQLKQILTDCLVVPSIIITLGSGTITDLIKAALFGATTSKTNSSPSATHLDTLNKNSHILISIPTALTVTAFTSHFAVLDTGGAKKTYESKSPHFVLWVKEILLGAPAQLQRAGFGDLLARFTAYGDWYLGYRFGIMPNFTSVAFKLMRNFALHAETLSVCVGTQNYVGHTLENFIESLSMAGIAMTLSKETTPLSGFEHVISHGLDFLRLTQHSELVLHGEQVALGTAVSASVFDCYLNLQFIDHRKMIKSTSLEHKKVLTKLLQNSPLEASLTAVSKKEILDNRLGCATAFFGEYEQKYDLWLQSHDIIKNLLRNSWPELCAEIKQYVYEPSTIRKLCSNAKLPLSPEETVPALTVAELRWAIRFSPFVRKRFSIGDFVYWMDEDPVFCAAL